MEFSNRIKGRLLEYVLFPPPFAADDIKNVNCGWVLSHLANVIFLFLLGFHSKDENVKTEIKIEITKHFRI